MSDRDEREEKIKVTDKRSFNSEGERLNPESEPDQDQEPEPTVQGEGFTMQEEAPVDSSGTAGQPQVDFTSFVLSLASTAFIHLGEVDDPVSQERKVDLPMARQMIDIVQMLRDKTRGNLETKEAEFIEGVVYELKMKFTQKASAG